MPINPDIARDLGNRLRVRVCGMMIHDDALLLINHHRLYGHDFWSFPGGGIDFGDSVTETLEREFMEECNLVVQPEEMKFTCEVKRPPLHAVELVFRVKRIDGKIAPGIDPERGNNQIISDLRFLTWDQIRTIPMDHIHPIFQLLEQPWKVQECSGFYEFT